MYFLAEDPRRIARLVTTHLAVRAYQVVGILTVSTFTLPVLILLRRSRWSLKDEGDEGAAEEEATEAEAEARSDAAERGSRHEAPAGGGGGGADEAKSGVRQRS